MEGASKEMRGDNDNMKLQDLRVGLHSGIPESSMSHIPESATAGIPESGTLSSESSSRCRLSGTWLWKLSGAVIMTLVVAAVICISEFLSKKDTGKLLNIITVAGVTLLILALIHALFYCN